MRIPERPKKIIVFGFVLILCVWIVSMVIAVRPSGNRSETTRAHGITGMPVSIRYISAKSYPSRITVLGEVTPRDRSTVKASVTGRIDYISDRLRVGGIVKSGEVLMGLEKSNFLVQLAEAESRLKTSRLNVLKEERETQEARKNWQRSGIKGKPSSPLALRQPQLEAARAEYSAAMAALENARVQLAHTRVKAPYDAVVLERAVHPGETVFAGDQVATLYSLSTMEIGISLDAAQWASLSQPVETTTARLTDPSQDAAWNAAVVRKSMHLDRETRLRMLFLEVRNPLNQTPPLLPGTFVRVELKGKKVAGLLCIPEAAQTKAGLVWLVDSQNRLRAHRTEPVFYGQGLVFIRNPIPREKIVRVALSPNSSFTNGLLVQPMPEQGDN